MRGQHPPECQTKTAANACLKLILEGGQHVQEYPFCKQKKYEVVHEIQETISGRKNKRDGIDLAIEMASQAKYDLLLFWNLDRFSRFGISKTLQYFETLESFGVNIKSYTQPYLDTSNSMIRELLIALFSYFSQFEVSQYSDKIKAGQERARRTGKIIGRPKMDKEVIEKIVKLRLENLSFREIARKLKISEKTVRNYKDVTLQDLNGGQMDLIETLKK